MKFNRFTGLRFQFFLVLLAFCVPPLMAQSGSTGALTVNVTDQSHAVISGATVTVSNSASVTRTATTNESGSYTFPQLPPGDYKVTISAQGFVRVDVPLVVVNVAETAVLNQGLQIGQETQQVTVSTTTQAVQTESGTLGTVVGSSSVVALPLTGRNYTQILALSAGVNIGVNNATTFGRGTQDASVNGATINQNNYQMDGVTLNSIASTGRGSDDGIYGGIAIPNPDAIQEFNIQTSNYDAGFGRNPGANIEVVTKSGTNNIHGDVFEFFRNTDLNANDYFRNATGGSRQVLDQNQFGFTLGGPIKKDKAYWFGSYQGTRNVNGVATNGYAAGVILPPIPAGSRANTAAFKAALGAAFCPTNHPGNSSYLTSSGGIQVACDGSDINPVAIAYLQAQLPNGSYYIPGSTNGTFQSTPLSDPAHFREDQGVGSLDYLITKNETFTARFFTSQDPAFNSFLAAGSGNPIGTELPGTGNHSLYANVDQVLKLTSILSTNLLNEAHFAYRRNIAISSPASPFTNTQFGITPIDPSSIQVASPITVTGLFSLGGGTNQDNSYIVNTFQVGDSVSWSHGKHTFRFGFDAEHDMWNAATPGSEWGSLTFGSFADFLIGLPGCAPGNTTCSVTNPGATNGSAFSNLSAVAGSRTPAPTGLVRYLRISGFGTFAQDDYKVNSHLTLNLGLRWEYNGLFKDALGNFGNVWPTQLLMVPVPGSSAATGTLAGYVVAANFTGTIPTGVLQASNDGSERKGPPLTNFGPRFGFAWQPLNNGRLVIRGGGGIYYDRISGDESAGGTNPTTSVSVGNSGAANYYASFANPFNATVPGFTPRWVNFTNSTSSNLSLSFVQEDIHSPTIRQYTLNAQYEFLPHWVLDVGYAGSSGINLLDQPHTINAALLASPTNPINGITTNTVANASLRVPYLGLSPSGLSGLQFNEISNYNSLQVTVHRSMHKGMTVQAAYTWSKALIEGYGKAGDTNLATDLPDQYGQAYFNRPQRLVVSYVWELPLGHPEGIAGKFVSGWAVSGVTVAQDGLPLTITDARAGTIYGVSGSSPLGTGGPVTLAGSPGYGTVNVGTAELCAGATDKSILTTGSLQSRLGSVGTSGYFNTSQFCAPPTIGNGTGYGNSGVGIVLGPGQFNWDISLSKTTRVGGIREDATLQFRAEFFNAFNHPQFANPGTSLSTPTTFGVISFTSTNPRLIQFALKYLF
jgi:hypothetical protein